jgi:hypothetical protein
MRCILTSLMTVHRFIDERRDRQEAERMQWKMRQGRIPCLVAGARIPEMPLRLLFALASTSAWRS